MAVDRLYHAEHYFYPFVLFIFLDNLSKPVFNDSVGDDNHQLDKLDFMKN